MKSSNLGWIIRVEDSVDHKSVEANVGEKLVESNGYEFESIICYSGYIA